MPEMPPADAGATPLKHHQDGHTVVWAFFVDCSGAMRAAARFDADQTFAWRAMAVYIERRVLMLTRLRCLLTLRAARCPSDQRLLRQRVILSG